MQHTLRYVQRHNLRATTTTSRHHTFEHLSSGNTTSQVRRSARHAVQVEVQSSRVMFISNIRPTVLRRCTCEQAPENYHDLTIPCWCCRAVGEDGAHSLPTASLPLPEGLRRLPTAPSNNSAVRTAACACNDNACLRNLQSAYIQSHPQYRVAMA